MSDYFKDPRLNASTLKCFAGQDYSPAVALQKWKGPRTQTKALSLGSLTHAFVEGRGELPEGTILKERDEESEGLGAEFILSPFDDFRKKDARDWKAGLPEGLTPIKPSELIQARDMAHSLLNKIEAPYSGILLDPESQREKEYYTDRLKAKLDLVSKSGLMCLEVKTTRHSTWSDIKRDFDRMAYHLQIFQYHKVSQVQTIAAVIVSSVAPYPVFQAPCSDDYLEYGEWEFNRAFERYQIWKDCHPEEVPVTEETLGAPNWWLNREK